MIAHHASCMLIENQARQASTRMWVQWDVREVEWLCWRGKSQQIGQSHIGQMEQDEKKRSLHEGVPSPLAWWTGGVILRSTPSMISRQELTTRSGRKLRMMRTSTESNVSSDEAGLSINYADGQSDETAGNRKILMDCPGISCEDARCACLIKCFAISDGFTYSHSKYLYLCRSRSNFLAHVSRILLFSYRY